MPTYGWACVCGQKRDVVCAIADRNIPVECDCGRQMHRELDAQRDVGVVRVAQVPAGGRELALDFGDRRWKPALGPGKGVDRLFHRQSVGLAGGPRLVAVARAEEGQLGHGRGGHRPRL